MKEKFLTILVPISQSDVTSTYSSYTDLLQSVTPGSSNINNIYKAGSAYYRSYYNKLTSAYEFKEVVDREFPYIGNPIEIYDFTYDAYRMGNVPTITANSVMWYADKDDDGNDITLDGKWSNLCHVSFNNENYYIKQIPNSTKTNEDARYKYDIIFVSERIVLERLYFYDTVYPFLSQKQTTGSTEFSFIGKIDEFALRINANFIKNGLSTLELKSGVTDADILTYEEFNSVGLGTYEPKYVLLFSQPSDWSVNYNRYYRKVGDIYIRLTSYVAWSANTFYKTSKLIIDPYPQVLPSYDNPHAHYVHSNIYEHFGGDYRRYLLNIAYNVYDEVTIHYGPSSGGYDEIIDGTFNVLGYKCVIGKNKTGDIITSEDKLITFENNTIFDALKQVSESYELQYYIRNDGGNTTVMIADCENDFADWDEDEDDYVRDDDGIPTTSSPFDYGVENELLSKEKANTTDKIITRITGVGSEENIPWYYPNPTADGWIKPTYMRNGSSIQQTIDYPLSEGTTASQHERYEKYLKNRIGKSFQYGIRTISTNARDYVKSVNDIHSAFGNHQSVIWYSFDITEDTKLIVESKCTYEYYTSFVYFLYKDDVLITGSKYDVFIEGGTLDIESGKYKLKLIISYSITPSDISYDESELKYCYPAKYQYCTMWDTFGGWNLLPSMQFLRTINVFTKEGDGWGWFVQYPPFLSSNANLVFKSSSDASKTGWYDGDNLIDWEDVDFLNPGVFLAKMPNNEDTIISEYNANSTVVVNAHQILNPDLDFSRFDDAHGWVLWLAYSDADEIVNANTYTSYSDYTIRYDILLDMFIKKYMVFSIEGYREDGWYLDSKKVSLADFGINNESSFNPISLDTIEFSRVKYLTPQKNLMPEVYIKTDGERINYVAHNYYKNGSLLLGRADKAIGEEQVIDTQSGELKVRNPLYKEVPTDADNKHYVFENEFVEGNYYDHIEKFDDVKPTIKGVVNNSLRIDIVDSFAYDEYDNNEVWETSDDGNVQGEYKHPYFFAKLRPLGFNLFDLALQDDMVLSMTTGHCSSCNFKIAVDEDTKKNPVQIWEYDVYGGDTYDTRGSKLYSSGDLRRHVDTTNLHYDKDGTEDGYVAIASTSFPMPHDGNSINLQLFQRTTYDANTVLSGRVGSLKINNKTHFEGDVVVSGRLLEAQQNTTENYVWVALQKDTETFGEIMPSAKPDYVDNNFSTYIEPKGHNYIDRKTGESFELDDDSADKFVLLNIRLPQIFIHNAERELSRKIIAYMYENNYQKFNFSIKFSRIYLAENPTIDGLLNENSVVYVLFNNRTYRQYVKHYSYKMSKSSSLPEISVEMNEELSVQMTLIEKQKALQIRSIDKNNKRLNASMASMESRILGNTIGKNEDVIIGGNIVSRNGGTSFNDLSGKTTSNNIGISGTINKADEAYVRAVSAESLSQQTATDVVELKDVVGDEERGLVNVVTGLQDVVGDEENGLVKDVASVIDDIGNTELKTGIKGAIYELQDSTESLEQRTTNLNTEVVSLQNSKADKDEFESLAETVGDDNSGLVQMVKQIKAGVAPIGGDKTIWNYITEHENKLDTIEEGAQVNVQPDWTATTGDGVILHKPTLGTASELNTGTSAGSVPVLGEGGKLSSSMLPAIAVTDTFVVDTLTEMYNLDVTHPGELEQGDVCVVRNEKKTFILKEKGTATTSHWVEFLAPGGDISGCELVANKVNSWSTTTTNQHYPSEKLVKDSLDGKASATHTHTASNITDFNSAAREQAKNVCLRTDGGNKMKSTISFDANTTVPLDTTSATKVIVETNSNSLAYKNINDFATSSSVTSLATKVTTIEGKESDWDAKYSKPSTGIPSTDLASAVQTILSNASTDHTNLGGHTVGKNVPSNAVFTDTHYTNYFLIKADDTQVAKFTQDADVTLNLKADSNVNFDIVGSTIYISATDTTYQSKSASSGSSEVSLVTRGEKYTWNSKGTVTAVKINSTTKQPSTSGVVDLGTVATTKADIGLGNVDNTSDLAKPISTAAQAALNGKAASVHTHVVTSDIKSASSDTAGSIYMSDGSGNLQKLAPGSNGQYLQMAGGLPNWGAEPVTYYTVTLTTNVAECPVTGGGQYQKNSTATIQAFPRDPYVFQKWSDNNTSNPRTVTVTSNITLQAIFAKVTYSVTLSCDTTKGTVSGGGSAFDKGSSVTITATPKSGYQFVRWSDNNTSNPRTLTMTQNYTLTAIFAGQTFTVFVESDDEDKGGATGGGSYSKNETCTLLAEPKEGYAFDHWVFDGDNLPMESEENPYIFIVESNVNVVVFFRALSVFNVFAAVTPSGGGSVSGDGDYNEGETATLIATANSGYAFDYWHDEGTGVDYETATLTFAVTGNRTLTAHFVQSVVIHTVTIGVSPSGSGTVTGGGTYTHGSSATITATANSGYAFVKWSDNNTQSTRTFTVNSDVTLTAIFEAVTGYVTDGLVFRLDGLEMGSDANAWTDLVNGYKFTGNAQRGIDGYTFNGTSQYLQCPTAKIDIPSTYTAEIVLKSTNGDYGVGRTWVNIERAANVNNPMACSTANWSATGGYSYNTYISGITTNAMVFQASSILTNLSTVAIRHLSVTSQNSIMNKRSVSGRNFGNSAAVKRTGGSVGSFYIDGTVSSFFAGTIKAIRIYNRVLTDAEILANQQLDMERFNIGGGG